MSPGTFIPIPSLLFATIVFTRVIKLVPNKLNKKRGVMVEKSDGMRTYKEELKCIQEKEGESEINLYINIICRK